MSAQRLYSDTIKDTCHLSFTDTTFHNSSSTSYGNVFTSAHRCLSPHLGLIAQCHKLRDEKLHGIDLALFFATTLVQSSSLLVSSSPASAPTSPSIIALITTTTSIKSTPAHIEFDRRVILAAENPSPHMHPHQSSICSYFFASLWPSICKCVSYLTYRH